jgi:hypothetical protein
VLPRSGGVLDQPSGEMLRLEKILDAFAGAEDLDRRRSEAKQKSKGKH